jgi:hypothetical protein
MAKGMNNRIVAGVVAGMLAIGSAAGAAQTQPGTTSDTSTRTGSIEQISQQVANAVLDLLASISASGERLIARRGSDAHKASANVEGFAAAAPGKSGPDLQFGSCKGTAPFSPASSWPVRSEPAVAMCRR